MTPPPRGAVDVLAREGGIMGGMALSSNSLVGRDHELGELLSLLGVAPERASGTGGRSHVLLAGDAGVGKTRLLSELRAVAADRGWQTYVGHCLDFGDSALPYLPFSEVLGRLVAELPDVVEQVAQTFPALARLQPGVRVLGAGPAASGAPDSLDRADLFAAVHALLDAGAQKAPLLLVLEDLHWADRSTRDLITFLFTRPFLGPVAIVGSFRADDLHRRHPLRAQVGEWGRLGGVERRALDPLDDASVRALVAELGDLGPRQVDTIVARAEGNAFFVEELVAAQGVVGDELADVLLVRLDALDADARAVVRTASASGRRVSHGMLAAVTGLSGPALDEALRAAVERHVLVPADGAYSFRHALLGEAVYDDLLPGERVRLHGQYAAVLAEGRADGTAAELARHARLAHDLDTALLASLRAGDEAAGVGGHDEAAQHYQQALELVTDTGRSVEDLGRLVEKTANALTWSGQPHRAAALVEDHLARIRPTDPPAWRARMTIALAEVMVVLETGDDPLDVSRRAVELVPQDDVVLRAQALTTHARVLGAFGRFEEAESVGLDALALAEHHHLEHLVPDLVTTLSHLKKAGPTAGLRQALRDAVVRAEESGAVPAELRARFLLGRSYEDHGEWEEAVAWFRSGMERAEAVGSPFAPYALEARWQLIWVLGVLGRWDEAIGLTRVDRPPLVAGAGLTTLRLLVEQARGDDSHRIEEEVAAVRAFWPLEGWLVIHAVTVEIHAAARRGDLRAALSAYDDAIAVLVPMWDEWFGGRIRLAALAAGAVARCLPDLPTAEHPRLVALADQWQAEGRTVLQRYSDPSGYWGPEGRAWVKRLDAETLRVRWLAGIEAPPAEELVRTWREAETLFEEFGHVHETATVRAVLSGILRATGDAAAAREVGDLARAAAHQLGARPLLEDLVAAGSTRSDSAGSGSVMLTPREAEILALVAAGRTNGEIGRQLFISTKTVSVHVSNILAKLGASGRTEAAALARRRGLL